MSNVCQSHSGLQSDIKWLQKGAAIGFALLFSAIVYFNQGLQDSIVETNDHIAELHYVINEGRVAHAEELYTLSTRVSSTELLCCEELE